MPLYCVYPALQIEPVVDRLAVVRVINGCIYIVLNVVITNRLIEDVIALLSK